MTTKVKKLIICALLVSSASPVIAATKCDCVSVAAKDGFIDVEVYGETLILTGFVDSDASRALAERVAKSEGYEVINHLMVPA